MEVKSVWIVVWLSTIHHSGDGCGVVLERGMYRCMVKVVKLDHVIGHVVCPLDDLWVYVY